MSHSPGPWTVLPGVYDTNPETACEFPRGPEIQAGDHGIIASLPMYGELNANLIAAAPDLLDAILKSDDAHWTPAMRAAIHKAIGAERRRG